jgi:hypothetical protein
VRKRRRRSACTRTDKGCGARRSLWRPLPFDCRRQRDPNRRSSTGAGARTHPWRGAAEFHRPRRPYERGDDRRSRNRQAKPFARWRWWRQHSEFTWPRRQEEQRRRWRRCKARPGKHENRLLEIDQFVGRRRRHAEIVVREIRWRLGRGGQHFQATARVPYVRTIGIAAQVRPVGWRRVGCHGTAPDDLLAAHCDHCSDARGVGTVWIDGEELFVAIDGVAFERRCVGVVNAAEIADRFAAYLSHRHDIRRWRCVGGTFGHVERSIDLGDGPRHFGAFGDVADA